MTISVEVRFKKNEEILLPNASGIDMWQEDEPHFVSQRSGEKASARSNGYEHIRRRVDEISNNEEVYEQFMRYMRQVKRSRLQSVTGVAQTPFQSTIQKNITNAKQWESVVALR